MFQLKFTPSVEDSEKDLIIMYYSTLSDAVSEKGRKEYSESIILTKVPEVLQLRIDSEEGPLYSQNQEHVYEENTKVNVVCKSDGDLPRSKIKLRLDCEPRQQAVTEKFRLEQIRAGAPLDTHYFRLGMQHPPEDVELAKYLARKIEKELENNKIGGISEGYTELRANIQLIKDYDRCKFVCSQRGVENQNSVAYILPPPYQKTHVAGKTLQCFTDGNPLPKVQMDCMVPRGPPTSLRDIMSGIIQDRIFPPVMEQRGAIIFFVQNQEDIFFYDTQEQNEERKDVLIARLKLAQSTPKSDVKYVVARNDENCGGGRSGGYSNSRVYIEGSKLIIPDNATVGTELFVACHTSRTQAHARFTITNRFSASLGVVLGICCALLLISILVIGVMIMTKKRQVQQRSAYDTRCHNMSPGYVNPQLDEKRFKNGKLAKPYYGDVS
ncbi:hypothetical protein Ciccas_006036 [Cichlidogyrus casuarinus]|uniref:Uncharacterized protein n=1 Tax=Cichlidogyrus casuarinus TaxID=1844966 RepID=A0ABD2Q6Y4_9PLAT